MFQPNPNLFNYPPVQPDQTEYLGVFPVDFILETVLRAGLDWFRTDPDAPRSVYGNFLTPWLAKYGQAKIDEIRDFVLKYDIRIVQHWALIDETSPSISILLQDGDEMTDRAGLADHAKMLDIVDADAAVKGRSELGYSPIIDNIQLGIHNVNTPDLTKYLYYLVIYILNVFKPQLEERGLMLGTFRATDISRLNEYLPQNMYSRFVTFTVFSIATFNKGAVPIVENIVGASISEDPQVAVGVSDNGDVTTRITLSE